MSIGITRQEAVQGWCEDTIRVESGDSSIPMVEMPLSDLKDMLSKIASTRHNLITQDEVSKITTSKEAEDLVRMVMISLTKNHYDQNKSC